MSGALPICCIFSQYWAKSTVHKSWPNLPKPCMYLSPSLPQSTNSMPSLKVALVSRMNSSSLMPSTRLNALIIGIVDSPTPTVEISSDSISRIVYLLRSTLDSEAAAIQPAVPTPTMTMTMVWRDACFILDAPLQKNPLPGQPDKGQFSLYRELHLVVQTEVQGAAVGRVLRLVALRADVVDLRRVRQVITLHQEGQALGRAGLDLVLDLRAQVQVGLDCRVAEVAAEAFDGADGIGTIGFRDTRLEAELLVVQRGRGDLLGQAGQGHRGRRRAGDVVRHGDRAVGQRERGLGAEAVQRFPQQVERQRGGQFQAVDAAAGAVGRLGEVTNVRRGLRRGRLDRRREVVVEVGVVDDVGVEALEERRGREVALVAEVFFERQVDAVGDPRLQRRIAAAAAVDAAVRGIDREGRAGAHVDHVRALHLAGQRKAQEVLVAQFTHQVQARQHLVVAGASVDGLHRRVGRAAVDVGRVGARALLGVHHLQTEVALDRHVGPVGVDVQLGHRGGDFFVDDPVLVVDVRVEFLVVDQAGDHADGVEGQHVQAAVAGAGAVAARFGQRRVRTARHLQQVLVVDAGLRALGVVSAEVQRAEQVVFRQRVGRAQAHRVDLVGHVRTLVVAGLRHGGTAAPPLRVDDLDDVRVGVVDARRQHRAAGGKADAAQHARLAGQADGAGVDFLVVLDAGGFRVRDVAQQFPVRRQFPDVFPADGIDLVVIDDRLGAHHGADVVDHAAEHVVALQRGVAQIGRQVVGVGRRVVQRRLDQALGLGLVEFRIEDVDGAGEVLIRTEFQHGHGAVAALGRDVGLGVEAAVRNIDGLAVVAGRARTPGVEALDRAAGVGGAREADRHADLAVEELVDVGEAGAAAGTALRAGAVVFLAAVDGDDAVAEGQRIDGLHVDGARQALRDQAGVRGFVDHHAGHQLGREVVIADGAAVAGAGQFAAIQQRAAEVGGEAADADQVGVAADVLRGQAGQGGDRFGDAGVRQFADVFGRDGFDDGGRIFLDGDVRLDAAADARHGHRLHRRFGGAGAGAGAAVLRVGRAGQCRQQHGAAGCDWAQFKGAVSTRRADASLVGDIFHQCPLIYQNSHPRTQPVAGYFSYTGSKKSKTFLRRSGRILY